MRREKRKMMFTLLVVLILGLGIGYAALLTNLSIDGTSTMLAGSWDVHFDNLDILESYDNPVVGDQEPTITSATSIAYTITFSLPGDVYFFTVDVVNEGTIDAMLESVESKLNGSVITTLPPYLEYSVTYLDGRELEPNHLLAVGETETILVMLSYKKDLNPEDLPGPNVVNSLQFGMTYIQADKSIAIPREYSFYTNGAYKETDGKLFSERLNQYYWDTAWEKEHEYYYSEEEAFAHHNPFARIKVKNGIIMDPEVMFKYNNHVYVLKGGGATYNEATGKYNNDSIYYEENKAVMDSFFPSSNCDYSGLEQEYYTCYISEDPTYGSIVAEISKNGQAKFQNEYSLDNEYKCEFHFSIGCTNFIEH